MRKIMLLVYVIGLLAYSFTAIALTLTPYEQCQVDCLTNLPTVSECMITSSAFWNINTDLSEVRKECEASINSQRLNCKMDCYIEHNMPKDPERERAIEFWDRAVKNFPDERVD